MDYFVSTQSFIEKSREVHGDIYDYSKVNYVSYRIPVCIVCKKHGDFYQKPTDHKDKKRGCQKCGLEKSLFNKYSTSRFIDKCRIIFNKKYDYSLVEYTNCKNYVDIICPTHGKFQQIASYHMRGKGCPSCKESKNELRISNILMENNILFTRQHKFDGCINKYKLPFDFYLPSYNMCIEYDGEMHFKEIEKFGGKGKVDYYKKNDEIKTKFCLVSNIKLCRIKYNQDVDLEMKNILLNVRR